jgi:cyclopropane fatty-acyl-phospholipid synthase-like methyltransferase
MPNSLKKTFSLCGARVRRVIVGIAQDFWKDGGKEEKIRPPEYDVNQQFKDNLDRAVRATALHLPSQANDGIWRALPGEISEKLWGRGYVTPGDKELTDRLVHPLGVNKDMSLLDLSAGLGGRLRKTTQDFGIYISGFEPDAEIAARGMELSVQAGLGKKAIIVPYDPMKLVLTRAYDCVIARETIYRVPDKEVFVRAIVAGCKPKAQVSFTDYIVNGEDREKPAIKAWQEFEVGSNPPSLVEMAELWAKAGMNIRVHEDLTDYYKKEVMQGLARFAKFMNSGVRPDAATKKAINKRITTWAHRMAAMEQGMKFYRFYGLR